jgi:hypothetical protein
LKTLSELPGGRSDKDIFEEFEKLVLDAGMHDTDPVEIPLGLALYIQFMLQACFRGRGRQKRQERPAYEGGAEMIVTELARVRKRELVQAGTKAGEAGRKAAEEAADRLRKYGVNLAATTIFRRMQSGG